MNLLPMNRKTIGWNFTIEHIEFGKFYIWVTSPDGTYSYNGYWEQDKATIGDALEEALKGSLLT